MSVVKVGFVEWPEGLEPSGPSWDSIKRSVRAAPVDLLVTNEMPFGSWFAIDRRFDDGVARKTVALHESGLKALAELEVEAIVSSRPVWNGARLINEAFILSGGKASRLHQKRYFPSEEGWYEADWFDAGDNEFALATVAGLRVGALLCTEVMFNEHARYYGKDGADLIVVPRATGNDHQLWQTACSMAAIVSGSYVVTSNRTGTGGGGPAFGGRGMAFTPDGTCIAQTTPDMPLRMVEVDPSRSRRQKSEYPCYVQTPEESPASPVLA